MPFLGLTFSFWMQKLWMFFLLLFHLIIYILDKNSWVWDHRGLTHLKALVATVKYKLNLAVMELLCYYFCILSLAHKYFFTCFVYWYVIRWLQLNRSHSYNSLDSSYLLKFWVQFRTWDHIFKQTNLTKTAIIIIITMRISYDLLIWLPHP